MSIEVREFIFRRCRRRGVFEGANEARGRGREGATWRGSERARGRLGDGATWRWSDWARERKSERATWRWGDEDTVVQSGRSEVRTHDTRHRTQGTGLRGQSAWLRAQGSGHRVRMKFICAYPRNPHEHISAKGLQSAFQPFNPSTFQPFNTFRIYPPRRTPHAGCRSPAS